MFANLQPRLMIDRAYDLDIEHLRAQGLKGVIFDLDNTIVRWGTSELTDELWGLVTRLREAGFSMCILSNNMGPRLRGIAAELGMPAVGSAMKPSPRGFRRASDSFGLATREVAVVGDQLFTDILGGNRAGCYTILVKPLWARELLYTKAVRRIERLVLRRIRCAPKSDTADR